MAPTKTPKRTRRPGRPVAADAPEVRESLLAAAGRLSADRSLGEVSLREVARAAEVTPAMVHYYFGDKRGLQEAMLERALERMLGRLQSVAAQASAESSEPIGLLLRTITQTFLEEPWIPGLLVREVFAEGGRLQDHFVREYASRVAPMVRGIVVQEIDRGHFREELDPTLAFLSLMGMAIFPFIARPVAERVLGLQFDSQLADTLVAHTRKLYLEGVKA